MNVKSLADTKEFKVLKKQIAEAKKDPDFLKFLKAFNAYHTQ